MLEIMQEIENELFAVAAERDTLQEKNDPHAMIYEGIIGSNIFQKLASILYDYQKGLFLTYVERLDKAPLSEEDRTTLNSLKGEKCIDTDFEAAILDLVERYAGEADHIEAEQKALPNMLSPEKKKSICTTLTMQNETMGFAKAMEAHNTVMHDLFKPLLDLLKDLLKEVKS